MNVWRPVRLAGSDAKLQALAAAGRGRSELTIEIRPRKATAGADFCCLEKSCYTSVLTACTSGAARLTGWGSTCQIRVSRTVPMMPNGSINSGQ